jgi:hypothetical protein
MNPENMTLRELEQEILRLHNLITFRTDIERARNAGLFLIEVKKRLKQGEFEAWKRKMLPGKSRSSLGRYMQVAKGGNIPQEGHLTIVGALRLVQKGRRQDRMDQAEELAQQAEDTPHIPEIVTGDSLEWMSQQPDNTVPFYVCDPPFGMGCTFDNWTEPSTPETYWKWFQRYWDEMARTLQPGGSIILWQADKHICHLRTWFPKCMIISYAYTLRKNRIWEPIIRWTKGGRKPFIKTVGWNDWLVGCGWSSGSDAKLYALHPCPKPLADCREIIRRYTVPNKLVVDCFAGTGSIPLAAMLEGRKFLGIEQSEKYAAIARKRLVDEMEK